MPSTFPRCTAPIFFTFHKLVSLLLILLPSLLQCTSDLCIASWKSTWLGKAHDSEKHVTCIWTIQASRSPPPLLQQLVQVTQLQSMRLSGILARNVRREAHNLPNRFKPKKKCISRVAGSLVTTLGSLRIKSDEKWWHLGVGWKQGKLRCRWI